MPNWEQAARSGDVETLVRLIAAGLDIDDRDAHGQTALMLSARIGQQPVVTFLVERGAGLNHTAKFHLSALKLAVLNNHLKIVETLVKAGAARSIRGTGLTSNSKTAMELAQVAGWHEIVDFLRTVEQGSPKET